MSLAQSMDRVEVPGAPSRTQQKTHGPTATTHACESPAPMPVYFDCPDRLTANGLTGFELAMRMFAQRELFQTRKAAKLSNIHTGPATRAKILVKKWKKLGHGLNEHVSCENSGYHGIYA